MKKKGRRKSLKKEEIAEDWCFKCKDGGTLLICDYKQCLKAYHSDCVDMDDSFLTSESQWTCDWHLCHLCHKASSYHCYCCPEAVCKRCIRGAEFVHVRGQYGLCNHCLKLALLVEENVNVDSDGESVDLKNNETYEGLFKEYYELIKEKIGLNIKVLRAAKSRLTKGRNCPRDSDSDEYDEDNHLVSDYEISDNSDGQYPLREKMGSKRKQSLSQTKGKSYRKQFVGWGSMALIQFLNSIGKDTSQKLTQLEVSNIIDEYVREHKLFHPEKKRKIICDASLKLVLGRKIVNKHGIKNLLEAHFAENQEESEDELQCSVEEDEDTLVAFKRQRIPKIEEETPKKERASSVPQSSFAGIVAENIKLVYLKRSLVYDLCKQPESLRDKVTGSFIRVKADPYDSYGKNSHQLMQVTGIKQDPNGEENANVVLLVSEMPKEISMSMLSNDDFTEAECEDLRTRVKTGVVKKPTLVGLEQKARILHKDITKHWIARELDLLQKLIDRANEKGWRRELFGYMDRKKLLQSSTEQERLLGNFPRVIPEVAGDIGYEEKEHGGSPKSTLVSVPGDKWEGNRNSSAAEKQDLWMDVEEARPKGQAAVTAELNKITSVDDDKTSNITVEKQKPEDPESSVWHISGTGGDKTTKYSLSLLKKWSETCPYGLKLKVWKENQSEDSAIWLSDAIELAFPRK